MHKFLWWFRLGRYKFFWGPDMVRFPEKKEMFRIGPWVGRYTGRIGYLVIMKLGV